MELSKISDLRREEKKKKVLNRKLIGESYIVGHHWRYFVLAKFKEVQEKKMTVDELLFFLKRNGVIFRQPDHLVKYPIMELLEYIAKEAGIKDFDLKGDKNELPNM